MNPKRSLLTPVVVLAVAAFSGGWLLQRGVEQEQNVYLQARLFQEVIDRVESEYVEDLDEALLYEHAIEGVIDRLGDPNSSFMNVSESEEFGIRTDGEYGGVGLEIAERDDYVTVMNPLPGGPGKRVGIRAGDRFVTIDGRDAVGWSSEMAADVLRGEPGTTVSVTMLRPGMDEPIPFELTREVIEIKAVPFSTILPGDVGYLPLQLFQASAAQEVEREVRSLLDRGATAIVLDLRGNPGGLLDQGVGVADVFLEQGLEVVETRGRNARQNESLRTSRPGSFEDVPLVVLVNGSSASAAEIVAGALQDHDRALVVGNTTFGKGSVQSIFRLSGGNQLRLTTAKWFTPLGRSIQMEENEQTRRAFEGDGLLTTRTGQVVQRPDTALRPTVVSEGGRLLYGGGGITPDLIVLPDTMTAREERATRRLFSVTPRFQEALFSFATEQLAERGGDLEPDFEVTDGMLDAFYRRLVDGGLTLDRSTFDDAGRYVEYRLGTEIAAQAGGDLRRFEYEWREDRQLGAALEALENSSTPTALLQAFDLRGGPVDDVEARAGQRGASSR